MRQPAWPQVQEISPQNKRKCGVTAGTQLLYGGVRQRGDPFDCIGSISFFIKGHKVIHGVDRMAPLCEPRRKDHVFLRFLYRSAVQNFCFNLVDVPIPPLSQLLVKTDS